jgi:hypothetical protein
MGSLMNEQRFISLLQSEERAAVGYRSTEISIEQEEALQYYEGEPFGNEEEGHSKVVSRDVASTIDGIMPDLLRVFVSGQRVVEFEPEKPEDEQFADQATDYANYIFYRDNDGFTIAHDWAKDGLLNKVGIVKSYWDDSTEKVRETYTGLTEEAIVTLAQEAEIIEATPYEETLGDKVINLIDVTVIREKPKGRVIIENIPPEEFLLAPRTRCLKDADYTAHKTRKTISELLAMGFDEDKVKGLSTHEDGDTIDSREQERFKDEDYLTDTEDSIDPMMREVWVMEEYIRADYDEDEITELRKVTRVNKTVLENVEVDEHPFADFTPNKMPHKVIGKSLADSTMDIQLVKSTLLRQVMDNLYQTNNPRIEVPDSIVSEDTFDDLLTVRPGAPIRTRGAGGLRPIDIPFTAGQSFNMLEYWDGEREQRTGVTRYNQGLDADTLNQTATGVELIQQKGMGKIELISRNLANAFGMLFEKILHLIVKHQEQERIIRLRGEWVPMQPNAWNANMKVTINVGLGSGDKTERIKARTFLMQQQVNAMQMGLVTPNELYNNMSKMIDDMELGEADQYWPNPAQMPPKPPQPNPEMLKLQADQKAKQAELQMKQQENQADMQMDQQKAQMQAQLDQQKMELEREKAQAQVQAIREKAALEAQLARDKANAELELAREKMAMEHELAKEQMLMSGVLKSDEISLKQNRPGGSLSE